MVDCCEMVGGQVGFDQIIDYCLCMFFGQCFVEVVFVVGIGVFGNFDIGVWVVYCGFDQMIENGGGIWIDIGVFGCELDFVFVQEVCE